MVTHFYFQSEKVYVQHILEQQSALVWSLLEQEAYFFVAGLVHLVIAGLDYTFISQW